MPASLTVLAGLLEGHRKRLGVPVSGVQRFLAGRGYTCTTQSAWAWFRGSRIPHPSVLGMLAEFFKLTPEETAALLRAAASDAGMKLAA